MRRKHNFRHRRNGRGASDSERHSGIIRCAFPNASAPCHSLWERWPSKARTERGNQGAMPSQSPAVTALPEGEPRGCTPAQERGCLKMICKNHERQPSFLVAGCGKTDKKFRKQRTNSEGQSLPLKKVRCFCFWRCYATVGTTRCFPNRPV